MELLEKHFEIALETPDGIKKLRELILTLAMQGKLVPQDPKDQSASELLKEIATEKKKLLEDGKIKKQDELLPVKPDMVPHEIPKNWEWVRFGEISQYNGRDNVGPDEIEPDTWVLDLEDIEKDTSVIIHRAKYADRQSKSTKSLFCKGDVLYGKLRPYLNKVVVADNDGVCTTEIVPIIPYKGIDSLFLKTLLKRPSFIAHVTTLSYGVKMPRLGTSDALNSLHPLPPLAEQKRIVAKIDQLMTLCDKLESERNERDQKRLTIHTAATNKLFSSADQKQFSTSWSFITRHFDGLYSVPENVADLKKTILQLAVMGKLVPQDPKEESAEELINRINNSRTILLKQGYPNRDESINQLKKQSRQMLPSGLVSLPRGWTWSTLIQLSLLVVDCHNKTAPYTSDGIRLLRTTNIRNGQLNLSEPKFVSDSTYERWSARCKPEAGDILITREAPMGEVCIIPKRMTVCLGQRMMLIRLIPGMFNPQFLLYSFMDPNLMDRVQDKPVGATVQHLRVGGVETLLVPVPPLTEQKRIVAKVDQLMQLCDSLGQHIKDSTEKKSAILNSVLAGV